MDTSQMVKIATNYHDTLQCSLEYSLDDLSLYDVTSEALSHLQPHLTQTEHNDLAGNLSDDEIRTALKQVPNEKASGLDSIPVELWKWLDAAYLSSHQGEAPSPNIISILNALYSDISSYGVDQSTGFHDGWMCPIHKKNDKACIENY
ncbi:hypothetical protein BDQ17DRAFT_1438158 [Cyathus striatus]|nr:hypothetical protein BDQ17DRAFT_1438158 [Cyathus striatus]